jgi:threonyl-tRNA synthetase
VYRDNGYHEVKGPQLLDKSLWEKTGHWQKYRENMFTTESEKHDYALKPMNCPGHILIFKQGIKSYRDLPLRFGEFGQCHRNEPTGGLHGIMRVRGFTQDDGHIFCTEDRSCASASPTRPAAEGLQGLRLHGHHLQGGDAARRAHRLRRGLGQGRGGSHRSLKASGCEFEISPATAPSTARRSSTRSRTRWAAKWQMRHDAGRLLHARAAWAPSSSTEDGEQQGPRHAAPRHRRQP